jgi:hypothetical protein
MTDQSNQIQLIYPTIDLFLYDLKSGLGQDEDKLALNRKEFWLKIYASVTDSEINKLAKSEKEGSDYVELLVDYHQDSIEPLTSSANSSSNSSTNSSANSSPDGYYYPVQLGDTYGLLVDCTANYISDYESKPQSIDSLQKVQQEILQSLHGQKAKLGQTWFIWGQLFDANQDFDATAEACFKQLDLPSKSGWDKDLTCGQFFWGKIYDLWRPSSQSGNINEGNIHDGYHVLICLFPHHLRIEAIRESITKLHPELIRFLRYRHKIIWAYSQSQEIKKSFKQSAIVIQKKVTDINNLVSNISKININELQQKLSQTPDLLLKYTNSVNYIDDQRRSIKVNISNYNKRRLKLEKIFQEIDPNSNCDFFKEFSDLAEEKYLGQIESDHANISSRLTLIENTNKTVQSIIDIEKAKNDRTLNGAIAITGVGLATSQLASAVILASIPDNYKNNPLGYQISVFCWSLLFGFAGAGLTYLIVRLIRGQK